MTITIILITRGRTWEYRPILPVDGHRSNGFSQWYDLHGKMDFRAPNLVGAPLEIRQGNHKFYYLAYKLESSREDESGRPIPIYCALVSGHSKAELENFALKNAAEIISDAIIQQNILHEIPYSEKLNDECRNSADFITSKYLGNQGKFLPRRGLQKNPWLLTSATALILVLTVMWLA